MHTPVLLSEVLEGLGVRGGGTYIDGTVGNAGHSEAILRRAGAQGRLLGIDRDEEALARAGERLKGMTGKVVLVHGNYSDVAEIARPSGYEKADGILLDLGVSSDQLDTPARGFSFQCEGPLDMRMDRSSSPTAQELVASLSEDDLHRVLRENGEEPAARRIARAIVRERDGAPVTSTLQLASLVERAVGRPRGRTHPATRTFQALRMAVNRELDSLRQGLEAGLGLLAPGGRMAVISFHSLEDRIVKRTFARHVGKHESLQEGGTRWVGDQPRMRWVTRKPIVPSPGETSDNPRCRSAKLRIVERTESETP